MVEVIRLLQAFSTDSNLALKANLDFVGVGVGFKVFVTVGVGVVV